MSTTPAPPPSHAAINARAQAIWEAAGCPEGGAIGHWLEAERELKAQTGPETPAPPKDLADSPPQRPR